MNVYSGDANIRQLRTLLIEARRRHSIPLLREVEDGLLYLGNRGYRCCLIDYEPEGVRYYVRLLGYSNARVKVQIEFPIAPELRPVQWVPLSHLADYDEVDDPYVMHRLHEQVAEFIHQPQVALTRAVAQLPPVRPTARGPARRENDSAPSLWWYAGSAFALCLAFGWFIALRLGHGVN